MLQPPEYETIPAEHGPSEYVLLDGELRQKLEHYPKVVWQKIKTERRFAEEGSEIQKQAQVARQATKRALQALIKNGKVAAEGERADAIYRLVTEAT